MTNQPNDAATRLCATIREAIPLTAQMGLEIRTLDARSITTVAPLEPNHNIHGTAFAGSLYALSIITGWAMVTHFLETEGHDASLVQRSGAIRYLAPVDGELHCRCALPAEDELASFSQRLNEKGRARLSLVVEVVCDGAVAVVFEGEFTATLHRD